MFAGKAGAYPRVELLRPNQADTRLLNWAIIEQVWRWPPNSQEKMSFFNKTVHSKPVPYYTNGVKGKISFFNKMVHSKPVPYHTNDAMEKMSFFNGMVYPKPVPCCTNNAKIFLNKQFILNLCYAVPMIHRKKCLSSVKRSILNLFNGVPTTQSLLSLPQSSSPHRLRVYCWSWKNNDSLYTFVSDLPKISKDKLLQIKKL
jgi:hypothetical protein